MSAAFNADEVFEMAEEMERGGARFYRKAAGGREGSEEGDALLGLAKMEDGHEVAFHALRMELTGDGSPGELDTDGEVALYLDAFVAGHVFDRGDPSALLKGDETLADVYRTAIGLERDSIAFYLGVRDLVPGDDGKEKVDHIIAEEMGHVRDLSGRLKALGA